MQATETIDEKPEAAAETEVGEGGIHDLGLSFERMLATYVTSTLFLLALFLPATSVSSAAAIGYAIMAGALLTMVADISLYHYREGQP